VLVKKSWLLNTRDCVSSFLSREPFEVAAARVGCGLRCLGARVLSTLAVGIM
jgi:hypothetical protein